MGLTVEDRKGTVGTVLSFVRMRYHCSGALQDKAPPFRDLGLGTGERWGVELWWWWCWWWYKNTQWRSQSWSTVREAPGVPVPGSSLDMNDG